MRGIGKGRAGGGGRDAGQVDVVLDREGHAVQRQLGDTASVQRAEVGFEFAITEQVDEQVIVRVQRGGFVAQAANQFTRGELAAAVGGMQGVQAQVVGHGHTP
ncbi:hypothetical protein D3C87_1950080 [compost metagenome]